MKLKKIKIKNFRSYLDQELVFPEGSFLLSGDIGSGKTSILLAVEYALFGLQPGQKGASLLRNSEEIGEVLLELEILGKEVIVERRLKRTQKGVSNEYAAITVDGVKEELSLTEIKLKVVNLLGYPPEFVKKNNVLYRYTVYTQQEQMKQIILEDPESRLNILRHVFGIDKYREIKNNLLILVSCLKTDSKALQGEISSLELDKENLQVRKSNLNTILEKTELLRKVLEEKTLNRKTFEDGIKNLQEKINKKREFESEVDKSNILITTKKEIFASLTKEIEELNIFLLESGKLFNEDEYNSVKEEIRIKKEDFEKLNSRDMDLKSKINSYEKDKEETLQKKERIFKIDICPTCLQDVQESYKHNILNETESKIANIVKELGKIKTLRGEVSSLAKVQRVRIDELEKNKLELEILKSKLEQIKKSKLKIIELENQKKKLGEDELLLIKHIDSLKEKVLEYSVFENQFKIKERELNEAAQDEKATEISLAESMKELELTKREIVLAEETVLKKENTKKRLLELSELIDWLSTKFLNLIELIERNVLLKLRREFSVLFRTWFLMLVPENSLDAQIDENFTPIIIQGEIEMDYAFLSGGERTAAALAYRLALNQTINSFMSKIQTKGLIILDEPTDGFSDAQIDKVRDILDELAVDQLIIVSHEQKVEGFVENVFKVTKEGDVSVVETNPPQNLNTSTISV